VLLLLLLLLMMMMYDDGVAAMCDDGENDDCIRRWLAQPVNQHITLILLVWQPQGWIRMELQQNKM
jgi:hypothetical protein